MWGADRGAADPRNDTILIRVTEPDGPGITTDLLALLSDAGAEVGDMEQVVVRRQLTLGLAITVPAGRDLVKELLLFGYERGLEINFDFVEAALEHLQYTPGARTFVRTLRRLGYRVGIISGGFTHFTDYLAKRFRFDHAYANQLEVRDGRFTGELVGDIVDAEAKARLFRQIAYIDRVPLEQTVAVGDGANDLPMLAAAGLGIAFNAKPVVADAADTTLNVPYLDAILFMLGVTREEVEAADAQATLR